MTLSYGLLPNIPQYTRDVWLIWADYCLFLAMLEYHNSVHDTELNKIKRSRLWGCRP